MFIDNVHIHVTGGAGGAGCMSFRREAHVPKGGPDGGDGGHGGNIIVQADAGVSSLINYRFKHHFKAERGTHGRSSKMHGSTGQDMVLKVPVGTVIHEYSDETRQVGETLADLDYDGASAIVARGGVGGRGNIHFVTPTRRAPSFAELGEPAQEQWIDLEVKLMADAALVGVPSAGKSSLIAKLSAARPKIADYPFTTLVPNLGVATSGDHSFVVADIPGLIEGASDGKGLGHEFLRHIERSAIIVHIIDATGGFEGRDPLADYEIINKEIELYATDLAERPRIVVLNKIDALEAKDFESGGVVERLQDKLKQDAIIASGSEFKDGSIDSKLYCISALTGKGVDSLKAAIATKVEQLRLEARKNAQIAKDLPRGITPKADNFDQVWEHKRTQRDQKFNIENLSDGIWKISGSRIERMVIQTDWENEEAIAFLQHRFKKIGLDKAIEKAGVKDGDEIRILGRAFEHESLSDEEDIFGVLDI